MNQANQVKLDDYTQQLECALVRLDKCPVKRGGVGKAANDVKNTLAGLQHCARTENAVQHISAQAQSAIDQANWIADRVMGNV